MPPEVPETFSYQIPFMPRFTRALVRAVPVAGLAFGVLFAEAAFIPGMGIIWLPMLLLIAVGVLVYALWIAANYRWVEPRPYGFTTIVRAFATAAVAAFAGVGAHFVLSWFIAR